MDGYYLKVSPDTEQAILWMGMPCGPKPILGWLTLETVRDFADMLLGFYWDEEMGKLHMAESAQLLLRNAFDDD